MSQIRHPAVAGMFYPADASTLHHDIKHYLQDARDVAITPKALVVPHAGYIYSGPVAASAYRQILPLHDKIRRVVLLGPSHRVAFSGLAVPESDSFNTPLGIARTVNGSYVGQDYFVVEMGAYKRGEMLLSDPARLKRIASAVGPIQIVYAGKAHPHDDGGKAISWSDLVSGSDGDLTLDFAEEDDDSATGVDDDLEADGDDD